MYPQTHIRAHMHANTHPSADQCVYLSSNAMRLVTQRQLINSALQCQQLSCDEDQKYLLSIKMRQLSHLLPDSLLWFEVACCTQFPSSYDRQEVGRPNPQMEVHHHLTANLRNRKHPGKETPNCNGIQHRIQFLNFFNEQGLQIEHLSTCQLVLRETP